MPRTLGKKLRKNVGDSVVSCIIREGFKWCKEGEKSFNNVRSECVRGSRKKIRSMNVLMKWVM
jgi:hypothetical protein